MSLKLQSKTCLALVACATPSSAKTIRSYVLTEAKDSQSLQTVEDKLSGLQNCKGTCTSGFGNEIIAVVECNSIADFNYSMSTDLSKLPGIKAVTLQSLSL